jgi:multiple sugar transport system permease protein/raffinose/stachyose/melibiose transport system permease protein
VDQLLGNRRAIALLVGPALVIYTAVMLVPVFWSAGYTLTAGNAITGYRFTGLANFRELLSDPNIRTALWFTLRYAVVLTIGQVLAGYVLALFYVFVLRRASAVIRTLIFFPVVLPTVAVALMFQNLFAIAPVNGPVNSFLNLIGYHSVDWFSSAGHAFWIIIIMDIWRSMGFYAVLLYAGLVDIPETTIEAARIDGATGWRLVRHIVVPLSFPVLLSAIIFSINGTLKVFDSILALTNGGPGNATTPLTLYMFNTSFSYGEYGYGATIALLLTVICLIVTLTLYRWSRLDQSEAL